MGKINDMSDRASSKRLADRIKSVHQANVRSLNTVIHSRTVAQGLLTCDISEVVQEELLKVIKILDGSIVRAGDFNDLLSCLDEQYGAAIDEIGYLSDGTAQKGEELVGELEESSRAIDDIASLISERLLFLENMIENPS